MEKSTAKNIIKRIHGDYTFQRFDKRFSDVLIPDISVQDLMLSDVWILIDVSGSMSDLIIQRVFKETIQMIHSVEHIDAKVSFFSTKVTTPVSVKSTRDMIALKDKIESTGGTSFHEIFKSLEKHFKTRKPKLLIIMTDGFGEVRLSYKPDMPVIWILSEENEMPFGECLYVSREDYEL